MNRLYAADLFGAAIGCVASWSAAVLRRAERGDRGRCARALGGLLFAIDAASRRGRDRSPLIAVVLVGGFASLNGVLHSSSNQFVEVV